MLCQPAQAADLRIQVRDTGATATSLHGTAQTWPELPPRGTTMAQVRARLGNPLRAHPAVGQPPITRWDYVHYVLYFERNLLLDIVKPNDPVPLVHADQLR